MEKRQQQLPKMKQGNEEIQRVDKYKSMGMEINSEWNRFYVIEILTSSKNNIKIKN